MITTHPVKYENLYCDCQWPATLDVFVDGEFYCVACPECLDTVPGYRAQETGRDTVDLAFDITWNF